MFDSVGRRCAAAGLALALSGCATVGPNFTRPDAKAPAAYGDARDRAPSGPAAQVLIPGPGPAGPWWRVFGSPELDRVITQALADNPSLAEADATLAQAQEAANAIRGARAPQAEALASAVHQKVNLQAFGINLGFPNPEFTLYSLGGQVSYDLDLFGGRRRQLEAGVAQTELRRRQADAAALMLTGNVARQALTLAALRAELQAVDAIVADDRRTLELTRRAFALGGVAREQVVDAERELANDLQQAPPLREQAAQARHQLALLVGKAPAAFTAPEFDLAGLTLPKRLPVSLPSQLVRRRPDILAAEAALHAATAQIGVAAAARYPDIVLNASFTQSALSPTSVLSTSSQSWSFGPALTVPLFRGGTLAANKRGAVDAANASLAAYRRTVLTAFVQVADVLQSLAEDADEIAAAERAASSAEQSLSLARLAYGAGGRDLLQLIDAQRQFAQARLGLVRARSKQYVDTVQLFVATAADWTQAPPRP